MSRAVTRAPQVRLTFGARTDRGKVRENNEDHFLVARLAKSMQVCKSSLPDDGTCRFSDEEGYLMVVADGMGGAAGGRARQRPGGRQPREVRPEHVQVVPSPRGPRAERPVRTAPAGARDAPTAASSSGPRPTRTCTAWGRRSRWPTASAPTCSSPTPATHGPISSTTARSSRSRTTIRSSRSWSRPAGSRAEQAKHDKRRNIVTNVIGGPREGVQAEIHRLLLADGDVLLLCSDGLSDPVGDEAIAEVLAQTPDPEAACNRLVDLALERGGPDNITAIVARYDFVWK